MRGAARVAIAAGAALQTLALIVGAATAAKKKKAVEVADSATLQGQPNSDGPFDSTTVTTRCPKGKLAFGGWSAEVDFGSGPGWRHSGASAPRSAGGRARGRMATTAPGT